MAYVYSFGKGYYGLETEGVTISPEVENRIRAAFATAMAIPDEEIRVQTGQALGQKSESGLLQKSESGLLGGKTDWPRGLKSGH